MSISAVLGLSAFKSRPYCDHGDVKQAPHSVVAKPDRLRDKSPPSADFGGAQHHKDRHVCPGCACPFDLRPATARSGLSALRACAFGLIAAALFAVLPIGLAWSQSDPVIAKVNGVEIRESDLAMAEEDVGQNQQFRR